LQNAGKYAILTMIFEKFSGGRAPEPHTREGRGTGEGCGAPPQPPPRGGT